MPAPIALKALARAGRRWADAASRLVSRRPDTVASLAALTLGEDDAALAKHWLASPERWSDAATTVMFEADFARRFGFRESFAFMGGRVALSACIDALALAPGDEVIVGGYTCIVVGNAFRFARVNAVAADIELDTFGLDVAGLEKRVSPRTRAIVIQHLFGLVCRDYEALLDLARRRGLRVIEDCAHAAGASYRGLPVGRRGDLAVFSSERSKLFNTGMGGLAATGDAALAERLRDYASRLAYPDPDVVERRLRTLLLDYFELKRGSWWRRDLADAAHGHMRATTITPEELKGRLPPGYPRRLPAPLADIGLNQLGKLEAYNALRRRNASRWDRWCDAAGYRKPMVVRDSVPVYLSYPVLVEPEKRRDTAWATAELGAAPGAWFNNDFKPSPWRAAEGCPKAAEAHARCVYFPTLYYDRRTPLAA